MVTVLSAIFRYRSAAEHVACEQEHELNATRTVVSNPVERFFLAPLNVNYHLEHHLYPRVPFHNLGRLHRRLYADRDYRENAHINRSYLFGRDSVLREIVLRSGSATEETTFS